MRPYRMQDRRRSVDPMSRDQVGLLGFAAGIMLCMIISLVFNHLGEIQTNLECHPKEVQK